MPIGPEIEACLLSGLSILAIILESSQLRSHQEDIHDRWKLILVHTINISCSSNWTIWKPSVLVSIFYLQPSSPEEGTHCCWKMLDQWGIKLCQHFVANVKGKETRGQNLLKSSFNEKSGIKLNIQDFTVEEECDLCSKTEINSHSPVVCVARGNWSFYRGLYLSQEVINFSDRFTFWLDSWSISSSCNPHLVR